jgi:hypothetical protein
MGWQDGEKETSTSSGRLEFFEWSAGSATNKTNNSPNLGQGPLLLGPTVIKNARVSTTHECTAALSGGHVIHPCGPMWMLHKPQVHLGTANSSEARFSTRTCGRVWMLHKPQFHLGTANSSGAPLLILQERAHVELLHSQRLMKGRQPTAEPLETRKQKDSRLHPFPKNGREEQQPTVCCEVW